MKKTLRQSISLTGIGLHTGVSVNLTLRPASPRTGIVFHRTDLNHFAIEATRPHVARVSYATTLMRKGVLISTVEHLLSALYALDVTDVIVELDAMEVPIFDGSAQPFIDMMDKAGLKDVAYPAECICILKPIEIQHDQKFIAAYPDDCLRITYEIDFPHPVIGRQSLEVKVTPATYRECIAPARTFGFYDEIQELIRAGLIRGGSLDNAIVLDKDGIMNHAVGLRFPDEFVRHKILDLIGDMCLVGRPILGHLVVRRGGHAMHAALASSLLKYSDSVAIVPPLVVAPMRAGA